MAEYNETTEGGILVDGLGALQIHHPTNPIIFRAPRGQEYFGHIYINSEGGYVLVGGESLLEMVYGWTCEGGLIADGESIPVGSQTLPTEGGLIADGEVIPEMIYDWTCEGGLIADGESIPVGSQTLPTEGGVVCDGESIPLVMIPTEGGVVCGGEVTSELVYEPIAEGGVVCGGEVTSELVYGPITEGGVIVDGIAEVVGSQTLPTEGGVVCDGTNLWTYDETTSGGLVADGVAAIVDTIATTGGVVVDGSVTIEDIETVGYQEFANGFKYRKPCCVTCTNAPALVHTFIYTPHRETAFDLDFYDYDNNRLPYQIENYNSTTGELYAWVSTGVEDFYLYYGKYVTSSLQGDVWDSDYEAVYHLAESGNGTADEFLDSANAYHGKGGSFFDCPTQQTDFSQLFDGTDLITFPIDGATTELTVSGRLKISEVIGNGILFSRGYNDSAGNGWTIVLGHDYLGRSFAAVQVVEDDWVTYSIVGSTLTLDTWTHLAATYDGTLKLYENGVLVESEIIEEDLVSAGAYSYVSKWNWDSCVRGYIDEVRVSSVARSADYLLCEATTLTTVGQEQIPLQFNGTVAVVEVLAISGGIKIAGTAAPSQVVDHSGEQGVVIGGTATVRTRNVLRGAGGLVADGAASYGRKFTKPTSGGVKLGGLTTTENVKPTTGGVKLGGSAAPLRVFALNASGGVVANGSSSAVKRFTASSSGQGLVINGTSPEVHYQMWRVGGGVKIDGRHTRIKNNIITPRSGVKIGGTSRPTYYYPKTTEGGLIANGNASFFNKFRPSTSGGLIADGSASGLARYLVTPTSGVEIAGNSIGVAAYLHRATSGALLGGSVKFALLGLFGSITATSILDGEITTQSSNACTLTTTTRFSGDIWAEELLTI